MADPGFIQIKSRDGPPPVAHFPPVPPAHHPPPGGPGNLPSALPQGMRPNPHPQARPHPQKQPMMQGAPQTHIPPPPRDAVPRDLQHQRVHPRDMNRLSSGISDLRLDNMNEAGARDRLSTFHIVRLVKTDDPYEFDEYNMRPTWERVHLSVEKDIPQLEVRKQVRHLDETTKSVIEKKADCSAVIQQQLECAREKLVAEDLDPRYDYKLVQFESKLKRLEGRDAEFLDKSTKKDKHKKEKRYVSTSKKGKSKNRYERIAITAYFKRSPTPDQNCIWMLQERERMKESMSASPQLQVPFQQRPMQQPAMQQPPMQQPPMQQQPAQQAPPPPPPAGPANAPQQQPQNGPRPPGQPAPHGQGLQAVKFPPGSPQGKGKKGKPDEKKPKARRQSHSSSSGSYDDDSASYESEPDTPQSSVSSNSRSSKHHRGRSPTPAHRRPEPYGIQTVTGPRRHTKDGLEYDLGPYESAPPVFAFPAQPGRRVRVTRPDDDQGYIPRRAPPPRIIQEFRYVSSPEMRREVLRHDIERADRRIHRSRINAVHRDEDILLDNGRIDRLGEDIRYRQELQRELREMGRWSEPRAQQYMHQRVIERIDDTSRDNPFHSNGRRLNGGLYHN